MSDHKPLPRRMQQIEQQRRAEQSQRSTGPAPSMQQQLEQLQQLGQTSPSAAGAMPSAPQNVGDLKNLLQQYGGLLSQDNKGFITELIGQLEGGADQQSLQQLAAKMQHAASKNSR